MEIVELISYIFTQLGELFIYCQFHIMLFLEPAKDILWTGLKLLGYFGIYIVFTAFRSLLG